MTDEEPEIILLDDEGVEHRFTLYRIVEVDDVEYALLEPEESDGELIVLRVEGDDDDRYLVTLDDEEWDRVAAELEGTETL